MYGHIDRSHLLFVTVIHATVCDIPAVRMEERPRRYNYTMRTFVPQLVTHTHTRVTPSLFRRRPSLRTSFRERATLPPIRGHAHDTRPRAPGGAFNARSLSSTREHAACRGVKARPAPRVSSTFFCLGQPRRATPYSRRVRRCFTAYLPRERNTTSPSGELRIAYDESIKIVRNLNVEN